MLNSIISAILSVYLFFVGVLGLYPSQPALQEGINTDPVPYLFDKSIEGFRYLHEERELPFRLKAPDEIEEGKTYPMVVFLHGSGERGNDNQCHVMLSLLRGIKKNGTPCFILMPQLHETGNWEDDDMDAALTSLIDNYILENYPIDTKRIYVTGDSRGGAGTFDQVIRHPGKYAAAMPTCGYRERLSDFNKRKETAGANKFDVMNYMKKQEKDKKKEPENNAMADLLKGWFD